MSLRALIGDLAVATTELAAIPTPRYRTPRDRFTTLYEHGWKLFHLAIEVGIARALDPEPLDGPMLQPLVEGFAGTYLLAQLCTGLEDAFEGMYTQAGHVINPRPWAHICLYRSGIEFLGELLRHERSIAEELDTGEADQHMRQWWKRLYAPLEIPSHMPAEHWWWFEPG
ncbi:MAG: hypothetical protein ABI867_00180 [Kofleriaceae bacterium]